MCGYVGVKDVLFGPAVHHNNSFKTFRVILIGGAALVLLAGCIIFSCCKRARKFVIKPMIPLSPQGPQQITRQDLSLLSSHLDLDGLTERPTEYQYASLLFATKDFSNLLGEGGFGAVYRGTFGNDGDTNMQIAVKVLEVRSKHSKDHFVNEIATIGRIHHVHVVRLLSFCIEERHEMLVYEYVSNGSLDKWLFCRNGGQQYPVLLWEQRYRIAIGIARGLNYLHEECRHRIVHCDIKPQNILLDAQMRPKISDFGLARLMGREQSRVVTLARGTPGYMGPEFWVGGESQLSTKLDVYSYGMVLLELISGQRNFADGMGIPEMAYEAAMRGDFEAILDAKLGVATTRCNNVECIIEDGMMELRQYQVRTALRVALWCIQDHPKDRPSMRDVVKYLEGMVSVGERPPRPTIASFLISTSAHEQPLSVNNSALSYDITPFRSIMGH